MGFLKRENNQNLKKKKKKIAAKKNLSESPILYLPGEDQQRYCQLAGALNEGFFKHGLKISQNA